MKSANNPALLLACAALAVSACNMQSTASQANAAATADCSAGKIIGASDAGLELIQLCVESGGKTRSFSVEKATSPREQAQGLMFRKSLADDAGMIFPFNPPKPASFWMKNTLIPLDIIFVAPDGTIESIAENTVPYSEEPVKSLGLTKAVLELRGGLTAELGIKAGDRVNW